MFTQQLKALTLLLAAAGVACFINSAQADENLTSNVTATVDNGFTLTEADDLNYGTILALADTTGVKVATYDINPDGTTNITNDAPAQFINVNNLQTNAEFSITAAAPNTTLSVTLDTLVNLSCGACAVGTPVFTLVSVDADDTTPTTSGGGAATVKVGGVISTVAGGNQYVDGSYVGSFDITVAY